MGVEMSYPGVKGTIMVPESRVARYRGRGWKLVKKTKTSDPGTGSETVPGEGKTQKEN